MSHIVTIRTQVRDPLAVQSACSRLKLPAPINGPCKLFTSEKNGLGCEAQWLDLSSRLQHQHRRS